jgi:hypothetical protein
MTATNRLERGSQETSFVKIRIQRLYVEAVAREAIEIEEINLLTRLKRN